MGPFQVALAVKNPTANSEDARHSGSALGWEDPLEKAMATHSTILTWRIPEREEPGGLQSMGLQRVGPDCAQEHVTDSVVKSDAVIVW